MTKTKMTDRIKITITDTKINAGCFVSVNNKWCCPVHDDKKEVKNE